MKKQNQFKWTSLALVILLIVASLTVAIQAVSLNATGPDGSGRMVYTFPANATADEVSMKGGDPFGKPYAKYDFKSGNGTFHFDGEHNDHNLFKVTHQENGYKRDTCTIELKADAKTSFTVSYLTSKQSNPTWKFVINITLNPGDKIVGLPAPDYGNDFSHINIYGAVAALPIVTSPATTTTIATKAPTTTTAAPTTTTAAPTTTTAAPTTTTAAPTTTTAAPTTTTAAPTTTTAAPTTTTAAPTTTTAAPTTTTAAPTTTTAAPTTTTAAPTTTTAAPTTTTAAPTTTTAAPTTTTAAPTTTAEATTTTAEATTTTAAATTTTAAGINVIEEQLPLASNGTTTLLTTPTTPAAPTTPTTLTVSTEAIPLADTGESLSGYTLAGILFILAAAILVWKRQVAKGKA